MKRRTKWVVFIASTILTLGALMAFAKHNHIRMHKNYNGNNCQNWQHHQSTDTQKDSIKLNKN